MARSRGTLLDPLEEEEEETAYNKTRYSHSLCSGLGGEQAYYNIFSSFLQGI